MVRSVACRGEAGSSSFRTRAIMPDGADLNAATIKGDLEKVKELLAAGVSPDYSDKAHVRCFKDTPIKCTSLTF